MTTLTTTQTPSLFPGKEPSNFTVLLVTAVLVTLVKILLYPSYRSTDFDVHRNWLAITHHVPVEQWYFEDLNGTTVHTLDYPPLFAWFEYSLSRNPITLKLISSGWLDERCLALLPDSDNEPSSVCVVFHRATVILSDVVFLGGSLLASRAILGSGGGKTTTSSLPWWKNRATVATLLLWTNPGMLLLDHVHFQYNGMLLGILFLSMGCLAKGSDKTNSFHHTWTLTGASLYAALIFLKHLYVTLGPFYFVYLLQNYCFVGPTDKIRRYFSLKRFFLLGMTVLAVFTLPLFPWMMLEASSSVSFVEQLQQMLKRLFPFQRGLVHDYWAANVWALYSLVQKCVGFWQRRKHGGAGEFGDLLPDLTPSFVAKCLLVGLLPALTCAWRSWIRASTKSKHDVAIQKHCHFLVFAMVFSAFSTFMLSYHVHEKAIMTALLPMTIVATTSVRHARLFLRCSALGLFALFPLLFRPQELLFKVASYIAYLGFAVALLEGVHATTPNVKQEAAKQPSKKKEKNTKKEVPQQKVASILCKDPKSSTSLLTMVDYLGMALLASLILYNEVVHPLVLRPRMEFLPLMSISVACAVGLMVCWIQSGIEMQRYSKQS